MLAKRLVLNTPLPSCPPAQVQPVCGDRLIRTPTLSIALVALMAPIASANAMPPVRAGVLQCHGGQNVGFVVGSVTSLECVFQSEGRRPEPYIATVKRIGLDLGVTEQTQLSWAVNSPDGPARLWRARRQLWRRRRERVGRGRLRRQLPGRRPGQRLCAAADQFTGADGAECRRRHRRFESGAGRGRASGLRHYRHRHHRG